MAERRSYRMGETYAQDLYRIPRDSTTERGRLAKANDELAALYAEKADPSGQLSREAGLQDIGRWRYGPPSPYFRLAPWEQERASDFRAFQGMSNMINPEQFSAAQQQWPESPRAVWSFDDRFRGM